MNFARFERSTTPTDSLSSSYSEVAITPSMLLRGLF
jgi:hypothetical protein